MKSVLKYKIFNHATVVLLLQKLFFMESKRNYIIFYWKTSWELLKSFFEYILKLLLVSQVAKNTSFMLLKPCDTNFFSSHNSSLPV